MGAAPEANSLSGPKLTFRLWPCTVSSLSKHRLVYISPNPTLHPNTLITLHRLTPCVIRPRIPSAGGSPSLMWVNKTDFVRLEVCSWWF